jgi:hypothetical protein
MNSRIHRPLLSGGRFSSGILMAMAVLVLAVSCPLKRMLQSNLPSFSSVSKAKKITNSEANANYTKNASCCGLQKKIVTVSASLKSSEILPAFFLPANDMASVFAIPYFLSGTAPEYNAANNFTPSALPLFLQHRRLLI